MEGFNCIKERPFRARIGIIANNENHCGSPDSVLGFGIHPKSHKIGTCGNFVDGGHGDNGKKLIPALGCIFVQ